GNPGSHLARPRLWLGGAGHRHSSGGFRGDPHGLWLPGAHELHPGLVGFDLPDRHRGLGGRDDGGDHVRSVAGDPAGRGDGQPHRVVLHLDVLRDRDPHGYCEGARYTLAGASRLYIAASFSTSPPGTLSMSECAAVAPTRNTSWATSCAAAW